MGACASAAVITRGRTTKDRDREAEAAGDARDSTFRGRNRRPTKSSSRGVEKKIMMITTGASVELGAEIPSWEFRPSGSGPPREGSPSSHPSWHERRRRHRPTDAGRFLSRGMKSPRCQLPGHDHHRHPLRTRAPPSRRRGLVGPDRRCVPPVMMTFITAALKVIASPPSPISIRAATARAVRP